MSYKTLFALLIIPASSATAEEIKFNRDIRPILSDKCFHCHGPDKETREAKLRLDTREGALKMDAIVPGDLEESELAYRITATDLDDLMPPPDSHKELSKKEIATLKQWIKEGAKYEGQWIYQAPVKVTPPKVAAGPVHTPIDQFIQARLAKESRKPAAEAERMRLIRRLSFDLTGLPPTPDEVRAFVSDQRPDAYQQLVNRLLSSPAYGERMAVKWLDLVRYADTVGFHGDQNVSQSPYRDYVINAFNSNMPFDRFTREQLAGDLLPNPTLTQKVASGYNRLNMTTEEGGAQPKEYLAKYAGDRVRNASVVWLGATLGCAECHDHKFDPYTTKDFYSFAAFFADLEEVGKYGARRRPPEILVPTDEEQQQLDKLNAELPPLRKTFAQDTPDIAKAREQWIAEARATIKAEENKKDKTVKSKIPSNLIPHLKADKPNKQQLDQLAAHFRTITPLLESARTKLKATEDAHKKLTASIPTMPISKTRKPRTMRVLPRGNWMDESGEVVLPAIPAFLGKLDPAEGSERLTRLDLANWITSRENPMAARVFVNNLWHQFFGTGISNVLSDLGNQGEPPSHPELLDWLAIEFMDSGWNVQHMVRLIVESHAYRQSSMPPADIREFDPYNRLLSVQSRRRLSAEMVRDNALQISGLLNPEIGGRSVNPYQPPGYYSQLNFPRRTYKHSTDDNQFRRALYSHWQRTFLHPALMAFDAPAREACTAQRPISNTPLQALVLMNDPSFVEAARHFAQRMIAEGGATTEERIRWAYIEALSRTPKRAESDVLRKIHQKHRAEYEASPADAKALLSVGLKPAETDQAAELAACTSVARIILNLHELITRL